MKKRLLWAAVISVLFGTYGIVGSRYGYGLFYQESRSIRWHFGGLTNANGKWTCQLGEHSSLIAAYWSRYWAEKHYKPEMGYPAPYTEDRLCIDIPKQGEAITTMVTWPARQNGRCYLADKPRER